MHSQSKLELEIRAEAVVLLPNLSQNVFNEVRQARSASGSPPHPSPPPMDMESNKRKKEMKEKILRTRFPTDFLDYILFDFLFIFFVIF